MKEFDPRLTRQTNNSTLKREGNFMADGPKGAEQPPRPIEPEKPKEAKVTPEPPPTEEVTPERQEEVRQWAIGYAKEQGLDWNELPLQVRSAFEQHAKELGRPGPGAMAGPPGAPPPPGGAFTPEEFIERMRTEEKALLLANPKARDRYFNRFFDLVDATPHEDFTSVFTRDWTQTQRYNHFLKLIHDGSQGDFEPEVLTLLPPGTDITILKRKLEDDFYRYQKERQMNQGIHDTRIVLFFPSVDQEQFNKSVQQFESQVGDLAFRQLGVLQMMDIYEEVLREQMLQNKGFLPPEAISGRVVKDPTDGRITKVEKGEAERVTKERFLERVKKGLVITRDNDGKPITLTEADFEPWQLERAFILATGMMLLDQRLISIMSESTLPKDTGQYISLFLQDILKTNAIFRHSLGKFGIHRTGFGALLFKDEKVKKTFGLLRKWNPKKFHETYEKFKDDPLSVLQSSKELFFIMKQNPLRGGDIFTHISWRANPNKEVESMLKDFATKGEDRMKKRWRARYPRAPDPDVYDEFIKKPEYDKKTVLEDTPADKYADEEKKLEDRMEADWQVAHPGAIRIQRDPKAPETKNYKDYIDEYGNWIGTGVRFEKLRGSLSRFNLRESLAQQVRRFEIDKNAPKRRGETKLEAKERRKNAKNALEDLEKAEKLLERMTQIQPHRLYLISPEIRSRINGVLSFPDEQHQTQEQKDTISRILNNFSFLETALLKERERLLNEGETFDTVSLEEFLEDDRVIKYPEFRTEIRTWLHKFSDDFERNKDKYLEEFIYKRDYKYGWVLWTGDSPVDEFNFTKLGATAGFARKARDNDELVKAGQKLILILGSLKHVNEPEDLLKPIEEMHTDITKYDASKADAFVAEVAEGIGNFFAADSRINIPVVGMIGKQFLKWSYARLVYGTSAPSWTPTKSRHFNALLKDKNLIDKHQFKTLNENTPAGKPEVALDIGVTMAQLIALAVLIYFISRLLKEKS